jgi:hypothetical protein
MATPGRDVQRSSLAPKPARNPLLIPLLAVCALALGEAVWIGVLSGRREPNPQPASQQPAPGQAGRGSGSEAPPATAPSAGGAGLTRGKAGERVESAGLAITLVGVSNERQGMAKQLVSVGEDEKYLDVEVLIENNTGRPFKYFTTSFSLKDAQHYDHPPNSLRVSRPSLEYGTIVQGEKVRGHIEFTVPKKASGLTLVYSDADLPGYKAIDIDLGQ